MTPAEAMEAVDRWMAAEYRQVQQQWSQDAHDALTASQGVGPDSAWFLDITMYLHRAETLGLDNALGRQALMKAYGVTRECAESVCRVFGPPPDGGYPSGEVHYGQDA